MAQIGHFGTPAIVAGSLALLMLILHLAVPFGYSDLNKDANDAGIDDETVSRGDIADVYDLDGPATYGPASPGLTLTGIILALVAGVLLLVTGFLPMPVVAARFVGWTMGLLGALGAFMAFTSSAYWLGVGFTTLLSTVFQNPNVAGRLWIISPVIVFAGGFAMFLYFLKVMTNVVAKRDNLRDRALHTTKGVMLVALFLAVALVMPWSFLVMEGAERRVVEPSACANPAEPCESAVVFYSALGHGADTTATQGLGSFGGIMGIAEATKDLGDSGELFQGLAFSIKVLTAMGWIGVLLGMLATFGPVLSSAFKLPGAARFSPLLLVLNVPMLLWGVIMFILASTYMWQPSYDDAAFYGGGQITEMSWWYAFAPLAAAALLVLWALNQYQALLEVFKRFSGTVTVQREEASFD